MRNFVLIFALCMFALSAQAQNFGKNNAVWHYSSSGNGQAPTNSEYYLYQSKGDTVFQGQLVTQIDIEYYRYAGDSIILNPLYVYQSTDKIYYYNSDYQSFKLLYDFNVHAGDTIQYYIPESNFIVQDSTFRIVIDSVKYRTINGHSLKHVYTTPLDFWGYDGVYIERIGSKNMMLPQLTFNLSEADGPLRCFQDSLLYINYTNLNCDYRLVTSIESSILGEKIKVYPNPVSNILNLDFENQLEVNKIEILDTKGSLILEYNGIVNQIDITSLKRGLYFLRINSEKGMSLKKIVKN